MNTVTPSRSPWWSFPPTPTSIHESLGFQVMISLFIILLILALVMTCIGSRQSMKLTERALELHEAWQNRMIQHLENTKLQSDATKPVK